MRDVSRVQTALRLVSTLTLPSLILQSVCKYVGPLNLTALAIVEAHWWSQRPRAVLAHIPQPCGSSDNIGFCGLLYMVRYA